MDLVRIPTDEFPLNWKRYNRLMDEVQDAARGFAYLDSHGWPSAREIDSRLMELHHGLWQIWNLIQESERALLARDAAARRAE